MLRKLRERAQNEQGFTLIELLVVILIIGILAAIAIPSFINQRSKGSDASAKSNAVTAAQAMETCATDNDGEYDSCTAASLEDIEPTLNDADGLTVGAAGATGACAGAVGTASYCVSVDSPRGATIDFSINRAADGTTTRVCSKAAGDDAGGCKMNAGSNVLGTW